MSLESLARLDDAPDVRLPTVASQSGSDLSDGRRSCTIPRDVIIARRSLPYRSASIAFPAVATDIPFRPERRTFVNAYVIDPPLQTALPVDGSDARFPVRCVYCIGRNDAAHAVEMGHDPDRDNLDPSGDFPYPPATSDVHHEVELAVALRSGGTDIAVDRAMDHVWGYAIAFDMTRRDLQGQQKKLGRPWEIGKAFERSAPVGRLIPADRFDPSEGRITLDLNRPGKTGTSTR